jgi:transcriptional regulator with XRE-family HTH domain
MGRMGRPIDGDKLGRLIFIRFLSQAEFAQIAGLTGQTVSWACKGGPISPKSLQKITNALRQTEGRLVGDPGLAA